MLPAEREPQDERDGCEDESAFDPEADELERDAEWEWEKQMRDEESD